MNITDLNNLKEIASCALASNSTTKSGRGYMGLVKVVKEEAGKKVTTFKAIKFLTHHSERGCRYDRTIMKDAIQEDGTSRIFAASEVLERTLLDIAAKAGVKGKVQDILSAWRAKSAYAGKTFLSREVVFQAVRAIGDDGSFIGFDLNDVKAQASEKDTSLATVKKREKNGLDEMDGHLNEMRSESLKSSRKGVEAEKTRATLDSVLHGKAGAGLTDSDVSLLTTIAGGAVRSDDTSKCGHGYMILTVSDGALVPVKLLTHYGERGAKTDRQIMKDIASRNECHASRAMREGELAFAATRELETILLRLAAKVGTGTKGSVKRLLDGWRAKSAYKGQTLLSRDVVLQAVRIISEGSARKKVDFEHLRPSGSDANTRLEQVLSYTGRNGLGRLSTEFADLATDELVSKLTAEEIADGIKKDFRPLSEDEIGNRFLNYKSLSKEPLDNNTIKAVNELIRARTEDKNKIARWKNWNDWKTSGSVWKDMIRNVIKDFSCRLVRELMSNYQSVRSDNQFIFRQNLRKMVKDMIQARYDSLNAINPRTTGLVDALTVLQFLMDDGKVNGVSLQDAIVEKVAAGIGLDDVAKIAKNEAGFEEFNDEIGKEEFDEFRRRVMQRAMDGTRRIKVQVPGSKGGINSKAKGVKSKK